ncbi:MAG: ABC transporter ATP-binding protein [Nitrospirae bacterium]|nr:ABC transporter ATP-binding protein [Nitrospirota bacterium]
MITLDNIGKSFGGKWAVRRLSITINDGEVFGLLGPNAAGKTTIIKMMTGLLRPTEGKILIRGYDIVKEPMKAKSIIGYVPDKAFFYEKLTGREFLLFIASIHGLGKMEALSRIEELINTFGIKDIENELIESYSQGMRQRLLFASSLIHNPEVLIIDEPFVGIDPSGMRRLKGVIKDLSSEGTIIFLATHSLHIAEELCNRVGVIDKGSLIALKNRDEIRGIEGGLEGLFDEVVYLTP